MRLFTAICLFVCVVFPMASAHADGAIAICTGADGFVVKVDLQKGTMTLGANGLTAGTMEILKQGLTEDKRLVLVSGDPQNPSVLVLNDHVGSMSVFIQNRQPIKVICE